MQKYHLPKELESARVSAITPLLSREDESLNGSTYGFVVIDKTIMLGQSKDLILTLA